MSAPVAMHCGTCGRLIADAPGSPQCSAQHILFEEKTKTKYGKMYAGRACRIVSEEFLKGEDETQKTFDPTKPKTKKIPHVMIEWVTWKEGDRGKVAAPVYLIYEPSEPGRPNQRPSR